MSEVEFQLKFPIQEISFNTTKLTFSINHIRSRLGSALYFKFICFNKNQEPIYTYTSPRWYIDTIYTRRANTFDIPQNIFDRTFYSQIVLVTIGIDSENPLYFTECMLNVGEDLGEYHQVNEEVIADIGLSKTSYANLYKKDGNYLQVIRPTGEKINTRKLNKSTCTVLAPHLVEESDIDEPTNIFLEFLHQREQRIDVLR